ncbi:hypothetical protein BKI52_37360 [marine bacterium AO1-C]|nr:hypothetical protein BKI52_37360 [marine bacterium AO1-C]
MKNTIIVALLMIFAQAAFAQDSYNVINIRGKVSKNGKTVRRGAKLKANDQIKFVTPRAMLLVSSQKYGRMVLSANPRKKQVSETSYILRNLISKGRASARGSEILFNSIMVRGYFGNEEHLVLGGEEKIRVSKKAFPLDKKNFFFINYQYKGEDVNKKLPYKDDYFFINQDRLFRINGEKISGEGINDFRLFYYKDGTPDEIGQLKLVFINDESPLKKTIDDMVSFVKENGSKPSEVKMAVDGFLRKHFGSPNKEEFEAWYKKNYE